MSKSGKMLKSGVGLAALAAAGAYFLYGERGAKNREKIAGWSLKMKGEVLEKMEKIKELNKDKYYEIIDKAELKYKKLKRVSSTEVKRLSRELKKAWTHISKEMKK